MKLIGLLVAWVLAAVAIAVVVAIVLTELLRLTPLVESGESSYAIALNGIVAVVFVGLVAVPIVFRRRFAIDPDGAAEEENDS